MVLGTQKALVRYEGKGGNGTPEGLKGDWPDLSSRELEVGETPLLVSIPWLGPREPSGGVARWAWPAEKAAAD